MANILDMPGKGKGKQQSNAKNNAPKVSIKQSQSIECRECEYDIYVQAVHLRKIPKMLVGSPQDVIIPVDVFLCGQCGTVNLELLPEEVRQFFDDTEEES